MEEVIWRYEAINEGSPDSDIEVRIDRTGLVTIDQGHGQDVVILLRHELRQICEAIYKEE